MARFKQHFAALLAALCFGIASRAADTSEFVLLIDLSPRMALRQEAIFQTAMDLAATGVHGRMQDGEKLTIWFYDNAFSTNAPPLVWNSRRVMEIGDRAGASLRAKRFLRATRPNRPALTPVAMKSTNFTAMILTDGYLPIAGTPFDAEINNTMAVVRDRFNKAKKPFLVTLLAHQGQWVAYGVHTNLGAAIALPVAPPNSLLIAEALAAVRAAITNPPVEKAPAPIVKTKAIIAESKPEPPPARKAEPKIETPPPAPIIEKTVAEPPAKAVPVVEETKPLPPVVIETKVEPTPVPPPAVPPPVAETAVAKPAPTPVVAMVSQVAPRPFPWQLLLASFGVIAAVGALIYLKMAQPKVVPRGSLISQSLQSKQKNQRQNSGL